MGGRHSRSKGQRGEREIVGIMGKYGMELHRGWQTRAGQTECDVEGSPWWIEVKRGKRCNPRAAYRQAKADTDGRLPVVFWRDDREAWMVTLSLEDFMRIVMRNP